MGYLQCKHGSSTCGLCAKETQPEPIKAAPLPDDVQRIVDRLRTIYAQSAASADNENYSCVFSLKDCRETTDMLERLAARLAELEAQREGFTLMPNDPTDEIIDAMREQITEHGHTCNADGYWAMYKAAIAAAIDEARKP